MRVANGAEVHAGRVTRERAPRMVMLCRALEERDARGVPLADQLQAAYPPTLAEIKAALRG